MNNGLLRDHIETEKVTRLGPPLPGACDHNMLQKHHVAISPARATPVTYLVVPYMNHFTGSLTDIKSVNQFAELRN